MKSPSALFSSEAYSQVRGVNKISPHGRFCSRSHCQHQRWLEPRYNVFMPKLRTIEICLHRIGYYGMQDLSKAYRLSVERLEVQTCTRGIAGDAGRNCGVGEVKICARCCEFGGGNEGDEE